MIRRRATAIALVAPASALVLVFLALPLVLLFRYSFNRFVPGQFMVESAKEFLPDQTLRYIPDWADSAAAQGLGLGYGLTFGALYAAARPEGGPPIAEGAALGLATWAAGYLGWLPASGLMPPVWKQRAPQIAGPIVTHAAYGAATVAAYDWLTEHL